MVEEEFTAEELEHFKEQLAIMWLFVTGFYVFFMQIGFGMFEVGASHRKNSRTVVVKTVCTFVLSAISFWLVGYGLGYGCDNGTCGKVVGRGNFALNHLSSQTQLEAPNKRTPAGYITWFFRFAFAAMCSTAASGGVAERCQFLCNLITAVFVTGFIHPVVAHWVWGEGWLHHRGVIDTSGSGVVSLLGGVVGLVGTMVLGPRVNHFEGPRFNVKANKTQPFSPVFHALGILMTWTGWYGLNAGAASALVGLIQPIQLTAVNTALAPAASSLTVMLIAWLMSGRREIPCTSTLNGVLAGLVAISSPCAVVSPAIAALIGAISGALYYGVSSLLRQLRIDDPLDLAGIHSVCGLWGLVATGLFATQERVKTAFPTLHPNYYGLFYGGGGRLLGWQLVYACVIIGWGTATGLAVYGFCHFFRISRVGKEFEIYGLDSIFYGSATKHERKLHEMMTAARGPLPLNALSSPATAARHYKLQQQQILEQQQLQQQRPGDASASTSTPFGREAPKESNRTIDVPDNSHNNNNNNTTNTTTNNNTPPLTPLGTTNNPPPEDVPQDQPQARQPQDQPPLAQGLSRPVSVEVFSGRGTELELSDVSPSLSHHQFSNMMSQRVLEQRIEQARLRQQMIEQFSTMTSTS